MSRELLMRRIICSNAKVDFYRINSGKLDQYETDMLVRAQSKIAGRKIFIIDQPDLTIGQIRAQARRAALGDDNIGLVIIDYLQLISAGRYFQNENVKVSFISRMIKGMARELKVPVLCLSQLNRDVDKVSPFKPKLHHLRDSGSIEQDADIVLFVYRPERYWPNKPEHEGKAEIIVAKQRSGASGWSAHCTFVKQHGNFFDIETRLEERNDLAF